MRSQLFVFGLTLLAYFPCYAQEIIVASVGGASDREIHDVVVEEARASGYELTLNNNYVKHNAATIAVGWPHRIAMFKDKIMRAAALRNEDRTNISLVLIGKSAGAMQIWAALDRYYDEFDDYGKLDTGVAEINVLQQGKKYLHEVDELDIKLEKISKEFAKRLKKDDKKAA